MKLTYDLFCYILDDKLAYEFKGDVDADEQAEWHNELYEMFRDFYLPESGESISDQIISWMRDHFGECSFDTHNFQLKETVAPPEKPRYKLLEDSDGHYFIVPVKLEDDFDTWLESVYDEERDDLPMPEGIISINGSPHRLTFTDPVY